MKMLDTKKLNDMDIKERYRVKVQRRLKFQRT